MRLDLRLRKTHKALRPRALAGARAARPAPPAAVVSARACSARCRHGGARAQLTCVDMRRPCWRRSHFAVAPSPAGAGARTLRGNIFQFDAGAIGRPVADADGLGANTVDSAPVIQGAAPQLPATATRRPELAGARFECGGRRGDHAPPMPCSAPLRMHRTSVPSSAPNAPRTPSTALGAPARRPNEQAEGRAGPEAFACTALSIPISGAAWRKL